MAWAGVTSRMPVCSGSCNQQPSARSVTTPSGREELAETFTLVSLLGTASAWGSTKPISSRSACSNYGSCSLPSLHQPIKEVRNIKGLTESALVADPAVLLSPRHYHQSSNTTREKMSTEILHFSRRCHRRKFRELGDAICIQQVSTHIARNIFAKF